MEIEPSIVLGLVDFTSRAVSLGFELDNGSASHTRKENLSSGKGDRRGMQNGPCAANSTNLLEDWDRIRLSGTLNRDTPSFRDFERSALVDRGELWLREADGL